MTHGREPRPDLGIQMTLRFFKNREGQNRVTIRTTDFFGIPVDIEAPKLTVIFEGLARDLRGYSNEIAFSLFSFLAWVKGAETKADLHREEFQ